MTGCDAGTGGCWQSGEAHLPAEPLAAVPRQRVASLLHLLWYSPWNPLPQNHVAILGRTYEISDSR